MGKFRELLENSRKIAKFRRTYEIPNDVQFRMDGHNDLRELGQTRDTIHIPLIFIVEGGLRFPLHPFFREVCDRCRLNPMQLCPNFVRVVMGTVALNRLLDLNLDWWDLHYLYNVVPTIDNNYYFKARNPKEKLITDLPNSTMGDGMTTWWSLATGSLGTLRGTPSASPALQTQAEYVSTFSPTALTFIYLILQ